MRSLLMLAAVFGCKHASAPPSNRQLAAGTWTTCLLDRGIVTCWGRFADEAVHLPTRIDVEDATSISIGLTNTCVREASGHASCWGIDWTHEHASGDRPFRVEHLDDVAQVACGQSHCCVLTTDGDVACWGANFQGATGQPASAGTSAVPKRMGVTDAVEISTGANHTCIRHRDGGVSCVGQWAPMTPAEPLHKISGLSDVTALASGEDFVCGLTRAREVWCAGSNKLGQLGSGDHDPHDAPVRVRGLAAIRAITASGPHGCALGDDGAVWCWGSEYGHGILPARYDDEDHGPLRVAGIANATLLAVGGSHACAAVADGTIECWGNARYGQTGQPVSSTPHPPIAVVLGK